MHETENNPSNPYASPDSPKQEDSRPYSEARTKLAKLSWKLPLAGLGISILWNIVAKPAAIVGGVIFMGSVLVGLVLSIVSLISSFKYSRVAWPAICGLVLNILLGLLIVSVFDAVSRARDAARNAAEREANGR